MMENYDAIIIGGGPAGAQCALWLKLLGLNPVIIEKTSKLGGLQNKSPYLNNWIVSQKPMTGSKVAKTISNNLKQNDIAVKFNSTVISVNKDWDIFKVELKQNKEKLEISAKHIVIATGSTPRMAKYKASKNVLIGPGKTVENYNFTGKNIAILGGGDNAFENFHFISTRQKPASMKIFARSLRARKDFIARVDQQHVTLGNYDVDIKNMIVNGNKFDAICVFYGFEPINPFKNILELETDNFISVNENYETSIGNIFAIGECAGKTHPCVTTSMAEGVIVAKNIQRSLS